MKKLIIFLFFVAIACSSCSINQNNDKQSEDIESSIMSTNSSITSVTTEITMTHELTNEDNLSSKDSTADSFGVDNSDAKIDYGSTGYDLFASAPMSGTVTNLTDTGFQLTQAFYSPEESDEDIDTNVVYDKEVTQFKTALLTSASNPFSLGEGQLSDLVEGANVLVYGNLRNDGIFEVAEIIFLEYEKE